MAELLRAHATIETLLQSSDDVLSRAGRNFQRLYSSARLAPPESIVADRERICAEVLAFSPTPFAEHFRVWTANAARYTTAPASLARAETGGMWRTAYESLYDLWAQVLRFTPFLLMCAMNRLREPVQQYAAEPFAKAVQLYDRYYTGNLGRRAESDQRQLLVALLEVFRALDKVRALDERFIFAPLLVADGGFEALFPARFDEELLLIQNVRNDIPHRSIQQADPATLRSIDELTTWAFLDIVDRLLEICRRYAIAYVLGLEMGDATGTADAIAFDGERGPQRLRFAIDSTPRSEVERFVAQRLYVLRRDALHELGAALQPKDYLDLTPFLISELTQETEPAGDAHDLFALDLYRRAEHQLARKVSFRQLAAESRFPLGARGETDKLRRLVKAVEDFEQRTRSFIRDLPEADGGRWEAEALRVKLWRLSSDHLASLLDANRYDDRGNLVATDRPPSMTAYDEKLFVAPPEMAQLKTFFTQPLGGMLLVGQSGLGKSTLLCDAYLERVRAGDFALFLSGRHLQTAVLEDSLDYFLRKGMIREKVSLDSLERFLDESGKELVVFIDAVNEYTGDGGPLALLSSIVSFVEDQAMSHVRVVASSRIETWARFRERSALQRPLAGARFFGDDAVVLSDFEDEDLRARLYARYREAYHLEPSSYRKLGAGVRALLRLPLMMALIGQTCGDAEAGAPVRRIPSEIDYFKLFEALTERKLRDAEQFVSPDDPRAKYFNGEMRRALRRIAELLYDRLSTAGGSDGSRDALPIDVLAKDRGEDTRPGFAEFMHDDKERITVYEALLQTHLIEEVIVAERDSYDSLDEGHAVRFFHDQYTQYWLAVVYGRRDVLGPLAAEGCVDPPLSDLTERVAAIVERSVNAPVLSGALEHWVHAALTRQKDPLEFSEVVPLLAKLAESHASVVRDATRRLITNFAIREVVPPRVLYEEALRGGTPRLQREIANAYIDYWPGIPVETTRALLGACGAADASAALERLGDVFSVHFANETPGSSAVLDYLTEVIPAFSLLMLTDVARSKAGLIFLVNFASSAVVSQFNSSEKMLRVRTFVRAKLGPVIGLLTSRGGLTEPLRRLAYAEIERKGIAIWNEAIGSQDGNNRFFSGDERLCQRDVLYEFFPYCAKMHNGELADLSLAPDSPFRALALRMMDYGVTSGVGYVAMATLTSVLRDDWDSTRSVVGELISSGSEASQFFGTLLLVNLSYANADNCVPALRLFSEFFTPLAKRGAARYDWVMHDALGIVEIDVRRLWIEAEPVITEILDHVDTEPQERIDEFGHELAKASFFPDLVVGKEVVSLLLRRKMHRNPRWKTAVRRACGALGVRSPAALQQIFDEFGVAEEERRFARAAVDDEVELQSTRFVVQTSWNRFIAVGVARIVVLRYLLIANMVGGLIQSNSVPEYSREFRRFVVDAIRAYLTAEGARRDYSRMNVDEVYAAAESKRRPGGGEEWSPDDGA